MSQHKLTHLNTNTQQGQNNFLLSIQFNRESSLNGAIYYKIVGNVFELILTNKYWMRGLLHYKVLWVRRPGQKPL